MLDTGSHADTADRLYNALSELVYKELDLEEQIFMSYCDAVCDANLAELLNTHKDTGASVTVLAVQPPIQYGVIDSRAGVVCNFFEKPQATFWASGGFFVLDSQKVLQMLVKLNAHNFEKEILPVVAQAGEMQAFYHHGFWLSVDTFKDVQTVEKALTDRPEIKAMVSSV